MKQFSHSKLQTFERCPLQYKFQYLTNIRPVREETVEAFLGSRVHETLELLYRDLLKSKLNSLEELLTFYDKIWRVEWNDEVVINDKKFKQKHYYNTGKKCIKNYYEQHHPFNQDQTVGIEKKINLKWGDVEIIGYVDRLSREKGGVYVVHDYKTGAMMDQQYADKDRQLALYSIAVKQQFKKAKQVKLVWHYVNFGEDVVSSRTEEELKVLKKDILDLIAKIDKAEKEGNFPAIETKCEWCGFWEHCPKKRHLFKVEKLPSNKYLKDGGVKLSNQYIELVEKKAEINRRARMEISEIQEELEKIEEAILKYSQKHKLEALQGSNSVVSINKSLDYNFPTKTFDKEKHFKLENLLKETEYWKDVSGFNTSKLKDFLEKDEIDDKEMKKKILKLVSLEEKISFSVHKK